MNHGMGLQMPPGVTMCVSWSVALNVQSIRGSYNYCTYMYLCYFFGTAFVLMCSRILGKFFSSIFNAITDVQ